jgi:hypothetical protein
MKYQNLTNKILGAILTALLLTEIVPVNAVAAQEKEKSDTPLILKQCWALNSEEPAKTILASDNDLRLFLAKTGSEVDAIELTSGKKIWQTELGGDIISNLAADRNSVFVATNQVQAGAEKPLSTTLRSISSDTGIAVWTRSLPYSETLYLGENENTVFSIGADGTVSAVKKADGSILWQNSPGKRLSGAPYFSGVSIVVPSQPGEIDIISTLDGSVTFQLKTGSAPASVYTAGERTLVWGDAGGNLYAVDIPSKAINWKFRNGGLVSSITGAKDSILVTSHDNFVYLMSTGGRVIWKRRLPGRAAEKPIVTQSLVIVSIIGESGAELIDINSGKLLNRISPEDDNYPTAAPAAASGFIILADGAGVYSYSAGNCLPPAK